MLALGKKLRQIRRRAGLTTEAFRLRWNIAFGEPVAVTTAYGWEQRTSAPNPESLGRFLWLCQADDATRLEVFDLFTGYDALPKEQQ